MRYQMFISEKLESKYAVGSQVMKVAGKKRAELILAIVEAYFTEHQLPEIADPEDARCIIQFASMKKRNSNKSNLVNPAPSKEVVSSDSKDAKPKAIQKKPPLEPQKKPVEKTAGVQASPVEEKKVEKAEEVVEEGTAETQSVPDENIGKLFAGDVFGNMLSGM